MIQETEINLEKVNQTSKVELLLFEHLRAQLRECSAKLGEYRIRRELVLSNYNAQLLDAILQNSPQKTANLIKLANLDLAGLLKELMIVNHAFYLMPDRLLKNVVSLRRAQLKKRFILFRFLATNFAWLERPNQKQAMLIYPTFLECFESAKSICKQ